MFYFCSMKNDASSISGSGYEVVFSKKAYHSLQAHLASTSYSSIFFLVDNNPKKHCLALFLEHFPDLEDAPVLCMEAGEEYKHLGSCEKIWQQLSDLGADRKSLLINVGGGVVTDLGGFVAAAFKRGIDFVNVPTSLLSMVDASVGGKTGVDFNGLKNQIGVITHPKLVLIDTQYLNTLPAEEYRSGYAEMLKHGIIQDPDYFSELSEFKPLDQSTIVDHIHHSVAIKNKVVQQDLNESNFRKILNYGHTLGHAIETYCLTQPHKENLLHGEAIAVGMVMEAYLASQHCGFAIDSAEEIRRVFLGIFPKVDFSKSDREAILALLKYDKKNSHGKTKFVLLHEIGQPAIDIEVSAENLNAAFDFYLGA